MDVESLNFDRKLAMENPTKIPASVYAEMTPNPATMKFVSNTMLISTGDVAEYRSQAECKNSSQLAEELFNFPFVKSIFIAANFVSITKTEAIQWDYVSNELREFMMEFLNGDKIPVEKIPEQEELPEIEGSCEAPVDTTPEINTPLDQQIVDLLNEYVKPAVESDGGAIHFKSFDKEVGRVTVILKGACSGCPSSSATLQGGIQTLLKSHIPEVKEVVALEL